MNRKKIFLIIALMGLSITGITLMQVHWMLKTIKLNEENFDRAVNETLTSVVDKLEKEKNIKFSIPFQNQFWYPQNNSRASVFDSLALLQKPQTIKENYRDEILEDIVNIDELAQQEDEQFDSIEPIKDDYFDFGYETYSTGLEDEKEQKLRYLDSIEKTTQFRYKNISKEFENIKVTRTFPRISVSHSFNDTIDRTIKVFQNGTESKIIIITGGEPDTVDFNNFPSNLIPPPPPPIEENLMDENIYPRYNHYYERKRGLRNDNIRHRSDSL